MQILEVVTSDHLPLYLYLKKQVYQPKKRNFGFENSWLREKKCEEVVRNGCNETSIIDIIDKLKVCSIRLQEQGGGLTSIYEQ